MERRTLRSVGWILTTALLVSCNVYKPLDFDGNDTAYKEEAQHCYAVRDYDCAVANYNKMSASNDKTQFLCLAYMNQAGLTLSVIINDIKTGSASMLGKLATSILPWTSTKQTASDNAATSCQTLATTYAGSTGSQKDSSTLFSGIAYLMKCATRLAHAHNYGSSDPSSASCMTSSVTPSSSSVLQADVNTMCDTDVTECLDALVSFGQVSTSLSFLSTALSNIPSDLKSSSTGAAAARVALKSVVSATP